MYYTESPSGNIMTANAPPVYLQQPTFEEIISLVAPMFDLSPVQLRVNKTRKNPYPEARFLCFRLIKAHLKLNLKQIGDLFGVDHTTIINGLHQCSNLYDSDPAYRAKVILAERKVYNIIVH